MTTGARSFRSAGLGGSNRTIAPLAASVLVCLAAAITGIVAGEKALVVIAALLAGVAAVAIAIRPDTATLVVVAILYSNAAAIAVQRYDVPYFAGAAFPLLLVVPFAYHIVIRRQPIIIATGLPAMLAFFIVMILGTAFGMAADPQRAVDAFVTFVVEGLLIYFVTTNVVRSLADLRLAVWVLLLVGAVLGALSVHQQATENFAFDYGGFAQVSAASLDTGELDGGGQPRLAGPIGEKNRYAQVMLVLVPLGLFRMWGERRPALRFAAAAATVLIAFGAVLTFSRGAALAFAITILLMTALRYIRPAQLATLALGIAVLFTLQPTYLDRLLTIEAISGATGTRGASQVEDNSFRKRANETIAALLVFGDHPLLGVGRGLFPVYYGDYADEVGIASENDARQAHNLYAGIAAETGAFGFLAFMAIFVTTLLALARVRRRTHLVAPEYADMATAFFLSIVAYLTTGLFLHLAYERYLWILLALAGSAAYVGTRAVLPTAPPSDAPDAPTVDSGSLRRRRPPARVARAD
ncbi:MAG TPA: O-antigen ligase family protein [Candidatus Limnocylindrales bacterium]|jgi:O-antigen ligase|nr:O-antigen ligase family protein [Candidatus Limnocylindrales bacterium]